MPAVRRALPPRGHILASFRQRQQINDAAPGALAAVERALSFYERARALYPIGSAAVQAAYSYLKSKASDIMYRGAAVWERLDPVSRKYLLVALNDILDRAPQTLSSIYDSWGVMSRPGDFRGLPKAYHQPHRVKGQSRLLRARQLLRHSRRRRPLSGRGARFM